MRRKASTKAEVERDREQLFSGKLQTSGRQKVSAERARHFQTEHEKSGKLKEKKEETLGMEVRRVKIHAVEGQDKRFVLGRRNIKFVG